MFSLMFGRLSHFVPLVASLLVAVGCVGCGSKGPAKPKTDGAAATPKIVSIVLSSAAFKNGQPMPKQFTADGADDSPSLSWSQPPHGSKELVIICDDPDAVSAEPWVHWIIYGIKPEMMNLAERIPPDKVGTSFYGLLLQSRNSWNQFGYRGPDPSKGSGVHHYHFRVYALNISLNLPSNATPTKTEFLSQMEGHVIGEGELIGTYER